MLSDTSIACWWSRAIAQCLSKSFSPFLTQSERFQEIMCTTADSSAKHYTHIEKQPKNHSLLEMLWYSTTDLLSWGTLWYKSSGVLNCDSMRGNWLVFSDIQTHALIRSDVSHCKLRQEKPHANTQIYTFFWK